MTQPLSLPPASAEEHVADERWRRDNREAFLRRRANARPSLSPFLIAIAVVALVGIALVVALVVGMNRELTPAEKQARSKAAEQRKLESELAEWRAVNRERQRTEEEAAVRDINRAQAVVARAILEAAAQAEQSP